MEGDSTEFDVESLIAALQTVPAKLSTSKFC